MKLWYLELFGKKLGLFTAWTICTFPSFVRAQLCSKFCPITDRFLSWDVCLRYRAGVCLPLELLVCGKTITRTERNRDVGLWRWKLRKLWNCRRHSFDNESQNSSIRITGQWVPFLSHSLQSSSCTRLRYCCFFPKESRAVLDCVIAGFISRNLELH